MARYFGGFRDRLKKRSKNVPITIKDVEWVKVATTFSWSPARRDYQWLEPEDYLSSFLSSSGAVYDAEEDLSDEVHGDGSMDAAMDMPFSSSAYDGSQTLIGISSVDDDLTRPPADVEPEEESTIAYVPPFDFVPDTTPAFTDEGVLRPNIDVPAELPLLDEYKLEIVSALQRRGIKIEAEKIKLPEDLMAQLNAYHAGRVSIDSYELRARLQKYKRQVIESYEQFNAVSGPINADVEVPDIGPVGNPIVPGEPEKGDDQTYEEFILSSLNRLEASMNDQDAAFGSEADMITPQENGIESTDVFDEANQTMDFRGSIRTTRHIETPPDTSDILAEGLAGLDGKVPSPEGDLPSSYADDSWLVLPVDSRKAGQDLENPDNYEDPAEQTLTVLNQTPAAAAPEEVVLPPLDPVITQPPVISEVLEDEDDARTDSSELLKALNTINSRFPEATIDADSLELNTADLTPASEDALITPTPPSAPAAPMLQPDELPEINPEIVPETQTATTQEEPVIPIQPAEAISPVEEPSGHDIDVHAAKNVEDETSLSDLLLQLRHEGDRTLRQEQPPASEAPVIPIADAPVTPVVEAPVTPIVDEPLTPAAEAPSSEESVEARRARYIEEERKKLYSIIDGLEESAPAPESIPQAPAPSEMPPAAPEINAPIAENPYLVEEPTQAPKPTPVVETPQQPAAANTLAEKSKLIENILAAKENMAGGQSVAQQAPAPPVAPPSVPEQPIVERPAAEVPGPVETHQQALVPETPAPVHTETKDAAPEPAVTEPAAPTPPPAPEVSEPPVPTAASPTAPSPIAMSPAAKPAVPEQPVRPVEPVVEAPTAPAPDELAPREPAHRESATDTTPAKRPFGAIGLEKLAASPEVFDTSNIEDVFNNREESLQNEDGATSNALDPVFSSTEDTADVPVAPVPLEKVPNKAATEAPVEIKAPSPAVPDDEPGKRTDETVAADAIHDATRGIVADFVSVDTAEPALPAENLQDSENGTVSEPAAPIAPLEVRGVETPDETLLETIPEARAPQDVPKPIRPVSKDTTYMSEPQLTEPTVPELAETPPEATAQPVTADAAVSDATVSDTTPDASDATQGASDTPAPDTTAVQEVTVTVEANPEVETGKVVPASVKDEGLVESEEPLAGEITLSHVVESLAFATEDPIPLKKIARIFADTLGLKMPSEKKVRAAVAKLNEAYAANGRTYRIKEWAGGVRMASHPQYAQFIRALYKDNRPKKLSRTLMETLAIIAYSQPSTKPEIDFVRGVDSDYAVRKLLELGLIDIVGRSDSIGRPLLYGTSERFLEQFGLSEIGALPKLREVEDLLGDPSFKKERLQLLALDEMVSTNVSEAIGADEAPKVAADAADVTPADSVPAAEGAITPDSPASQGEGEAAS